MVGVIPCFVSRCGRYPLRVVEQRTLICWQPEHDRREDQLHGRIRARHDTHWSGV